MTAIFDLDKGFTWILETEEAVADMTAFLDNLGHDYRIWRKP